MHQPNHCNMRNLLQQNLVLHKPITSDFITMARINFFVVAITPCICMLIWSYAYIFGRSLVHMLGHSHAHMSTCLNARMLTCLDALMSTCLDALMFTCLDVHMLMGFLPCRFSPFVNKSPCQFIFPLYLVIW